MYQKYKKINYYKLMSFRIEEKLYIKKEHIFDFRIFLKKKYSKKMFQPRTISSLYFDNINLDMYNDSMEGLVRRTIWIMSTKLCCYIRKRIFFD